MLTGETAAAISAYRSAVKYFANRNRCRPSDAETWEQLVNAQIGLAIGTSQTNNGERAAQLAFAAARQTLAVPFMATHLTSFRRFAEARLEVGLGRLAMRQNDQTLAIKHLGLARRILAELAVGADTESGIATSRVRPLRLATLFDLARLYAEQSKHSAALDILSEVNASLDAAIEVFPDRPDFRESRIVAQILTGNSFQVRGADVEAVISYRSAIEDFLAMIDTLYGGEYHTELLATAKTNLSQLHARQRQCDDALQELLEAKQAFASLIKKYGQREHLLRKFAESSRLLSDVYFQIEAIDDAERELAVAVEVLAHLVNSPAGKDSQTHTTTGRDQLELCRALQHQAAIAIVQDRPNEADAKLLRAIAIAQQHQLSWGDSDDQRITLAHALQFRGDMAWRNGDAALAADDYRIALELFSKCENQNGKDRLAWLLSTCPVVELRDSLHAINISSQRISSAPTNPDLWLTHAATQLAEQEAASALVTLDRSRQLRNGHMSPFALALRAAALEALGKHEEASEVRRDSSEQFPNHNKLPVLQYLGRDRKNLE